MHGNRAMMADVSHQLRTPLAALRLRLDLLAADADEATAAELAGAQGEIARLSRLVDGLLAVARAESAVTVPVPVQVAEVVRDRVAAWSPVAEERAVGLSASAPGQIARQPRRGPPGADPGQPDRQRPGRGPRGRACPGQRPPGRAGAPGSWWPTTGRA